MNFITEIEYSPKLADRIKSIVSENKVTVIRNVPEDLNIDDYYTHIGNTLGLLFKKDVDPINKKIIHDTWTTVKFDKRYIEQTYKHSNKHQPLHTDYCNASIDLDMVLLLCEVAAPHGGATIFLEGIVLVDLLRNYYPELYDQVLSTDVIFGRTPSPIFRNVAKILSFNESGPVLHWNYAVVASDNRDEVLEMCEKFHYFMEEIIFSGAIAESIYLKKNEAVLFHDKSLLHGRYAFLGDRSLLKGGIITTNIEEVKKQLKKFDF